MDDPFFISFTASGIGYKFPCTSREYDRWTLYGISPDWLRSALLQEIERARVQG